ncbi:MAG: NTP transferase domain-containing protein [Anaerolineae bacterium]|nr:NTP transferase domain-containing protein [Anaerolineae bacterium]
MPVVILCGGQGTRMKGETSTKKEMVEVGGRPIIWHVMKIFAAYGHSEFILTLGYEGEVLKRYFLEYEMMQRDFTVRLGDSGGVAYHGSSAGEDWHVTLANTGLLTNKGGRIARVAPYIAGRTFFVTYGDGVGNLDIDALLAFHRRHGKLATVTGVKARWQYGLLDANADGQVTHFEQKPRLEHWINGGFMVFEPGVLDYLDGDAAHLERDTMVRLAAEGQLMMYRHAGFWRSMDTFKEAQELDAIWHESAPWKVWQDQ